ncbi:hypothetical protein MTO96_021769 [Rhipicephalus appendiculatus]
MQHRRAVEWRRKSGAARNPDPVPEQAESPSATAALDRCCAEHGGTKTALAPPERREPETFKTRAGNHLGNKTAGNILIAH